MRPLDFYAVTSDLFPWTDYTLTPVALIIVSLDIVLMLMLMFSVYVPSIACLQAWFPEGVFYVFPDPVKGLRTETRYNCADCKVLRGKQCLEF